MSSPAPLSPEEAPAVQPKRKGRPKGSTNKNKRVRVASEPIDDAHEPTTPIVSTAALVLPGQSNAQASTSSSTTPALAPATSLKRFALPINDPELEAELEDDSDDFDEEDEAAEAEREALKEAFAQLMRHHFSEDQKDRYEVYRRSGFKQGNIRRLVNNVLQQSVTANIVLAFRGLSKVFVGEIVESARRVQAQHGQEGPLLPEHIREAYRLWVKDRDAPGGPTRKLFVK